MKQIIKKIYFILFKLLFLPFGQDHKLSLFNYLIKGFEKTSDSFITFNARFKKVRKKDDFQLSKKNLPKLAIVIQGPLKIENNFTLETVKLYKRIFQESFIIISTWEDENQEELKKIKSLGAFVIQNSHPVISGVGNINFQVKSTVEGVKYANDNGYKYILKTRTDQRIYKEDLFPYLLSLHESFPIKDIFKALPQKERIIMFEGNLPGNMLVPFHFCDFFYFGLTSDILNFFSEQYDKNTNWRNNSERSKLKKKLQINNNSIAEIHSQMAPEVILNRNYLSRYGIKTDIHSIQESWDYAKSYLITIGWSDLDLIWYKYDKNYNETKLRNLQSYDFKTNYYRKTWSFSNWLSVYNNKIIPSKETSNYCKKTLNAY